MQKHEFSLKLPLDIRLVLYSLQIISLFCPEFNGCQFVPWKINLKHLNHLEVSSRELDGQIKLKPHQIDEKWEGPLIADEPLNHFQ